MISDKMGKAISDQINAELYSAYLYMAMSAWCSVKGLPGAANWTMVQAKEEMTHAQRFYNYVTHQGRQVAFAAIDAPPGNYKTLKQLFTHILTHEQKVTSLIHNLATLARKEQDHATEIMLQWFITEQIEEEQNAHDVLAKVALAGDTPGGAYMLDKELATRTFVPPPDLAA